jgi:opacity protein-like surface antigen
MTNTLILAAAAAASSLALAGVAQAQQTTDPNWYVRGDAGGTFAGELNGASPNVKGKSGWTVDLAAGRSLNGNVRAEGELLYSEADRKDVSTGKIKTFGSLVNGYYDIDTGTKFRPYVGAGVGIAQVKLDKGLTHGDDTGLAYQLKTGVSYAINDRLSAQVGYRYLGVNDVHIGQGVGRIDGDYRDQAVTAGLTYKLGF